jgi:hypothetical protein
VAALRAARSISAGAALVVGLAACGDLQGLNDVSTPLGQVRVQAVAEAPTGLSVALVWAAQALSEPFCALPAESPEAAKVIARGCRDPLGFVPLRVAAVAPLRADGTAALSLYDLPGADVMVGTLTSRVAYGGIILYEDVNGNGTFDLGCPDGDARRGPGGGAEQDPTCNRDAERTGTGGGRDDVVRGASFVSMATPDVRVAFREGTYNEAAAFYPRRLCPNPPTGFSVLGAGGFGPGALLAGLLAGEFPPEDPATCTTQTLEEAVIPVPVVADPKMLPWGLGCAAVDKTGTTRYREPPKDAPDLADATWACAGLPRLGEPDPEDSASADAVQLVVASPDDVHCPTVDHFLIQGCERDPTCASPEWDRTGSVPEWWPCPVPGGTQ